MIRSRWITRLSIGLALSLSTAVGVGLVAARPQELQVGRKKQRLHPPELVEGLAVTREAVCRWAAKPPVLDGKLDDRCWQKAAVIDRFGTYWTNPRKAHTGTFAYLVWDDAALYYAGSMTDAELRSFGTKRNDHLWNGDVFELFLKPSAAKPGYFEFQANPRGLIFEMAFPRREPNSGEFTGAAVLGNEAVVALEGTLDQPGDRDTGWTVEGRIPWTAFAQSGGRPKAGDDWLFAICRYDYGPAGTKPTLMSSAPLTQPSFHRYEDYGKLQFEGPRDPRPRPGRRDRG
jgi:hypothetical protein